jgi:hypothetical protein
VKSLSLILGIIFSLFMTGIADAECAWVLWIKQQSTFTEEGELPRVVENWELIAAVPTFEQCLTIQKLLFENQKTIWGRIKGAKVTGVDISLITVNFEGGGLRIIKPNCFPDTIDPRK